MTCETEHVFAGINGFKANLNSGHELHWSRAGLPPARLPCHFSDDSIHTTTTLQNKNWGYYNTSMPQ
ncbi:hypothetical protein [Vibrio rotiferianus]|uniref:hypothetical protein n=1 Tax=Vibrio rotiferianus TaxID=190895 RepID=UPI00406A47E7